MVERVEREVREVREGVGERLGNWGMLSRGKDWSVSYRWRHDVFSDCLKCGSVFILES